MQSLELTTARSSSARARSRPWAGPASGVRLTRAMKLPFGTLPVVVSTTFAFPYSPAAIRYRTL